MKQHLLKRAPVLAAFAAVYVIWGSTFTAISVAVRELPPFLMAGVRWTIAGSVLYAVLRMRGVRKPSGAAWKRSAVGGTFLVLGGNGLVCWAEARVDSGLVATLMALSPLLIVILEWVGWGGAKPTRRTWFGLVAGLLGVMLLVGPSAEQHDPLAPAAALLAAFGWAFGALYTRHAATRAKARGEPPTPVAMSSALQMLTGGVLLSLTGLSLGEPVPHTLSLEAGLAVLYLAIFGSLIAFGAYVYLVQRVSPGALATHSFVNPVIAVILGWALLGETLGGRSLAAAALIIVAVAAIVTRPKASRAIRVRRSPGNLLAR